MFRFKKDGKLTMFSLSWVFTANFIIYFALISSKVNYDKFRGLWSVKMEYEGNIPDTLRKLRGK